MTIANPNISAGTLQQLIDERPGTVLLDVRTGGEFETMHIPGSHNVPLPIFVDHVAEFAQIDRPIVLVCHSGNRAAEACRELAVHARGDLHVLDGGVAAWQSAGREVLHGASSRWAMDRQVRGVAGAIALAGILASTVVPGAKWVAGAIAGGLVFSAVSNTCAMGTALGKLPYNQGPSCDVDAVLGEAMSGLR